MAQQVTALVTKPDNLSSTPRRHMVERENSLPQASRPLTSTCAVVPPTHTQAQREGEEREREHNQSINKQTNTCNNKNKISVERE